MNYGIDIFDLLERLLKVLGWESLLQDVESGLRFMDSLKTAFSTYGDMYLYFIFIYVIGPLIM